MAPRKLFLSSYNGTIYTLEFSQGPDPRQALTVIATTEACRPSPSWITYDPDRQILFGTSNDKESEQGAVKAFAVQADGSLVESGCVESPFGAAYHTIYHGGDILAVAFYHSSRVVTYDITDVAHIQPIHELEFSPIEPGPGKVQDRPRPHQVVLEPTGRHVLVPDLGADRVRVLAVSPPNSPGMLREIDALQLPKGSYPRHVAFITRQGTDSNQTQLYLLNQDANTLLSFQVEYSSHEGLRFVNQGCDIDLLQRCDRVISPLAGVRTMASHLAISPDERFVIVSVRDDRAFTIESPFEPSTSMSADTILTYRIDPESVALTLAHEFAAGGGFPRQFSLNEVGDRIAVVQQKQGWLSIFERDVETGQIGRLLAIKDGFGEMGPNCVLWGP
ncbi:hypothetical protein CLAIMM_15119 [Cladophialophora immunda]|nr:hypothetical protein CLAIMM_15119 [Cladophialophora immunda]